MSNATQAARINVETHIAELIVRHAIDLGYAVSVNDGEETTVHNSTDCAAILAAMQSTDSDTLSFRHADGRKGWLYLVWGNEFDITSDWSTNESGNGPIDVILAPVLAWCDQAQAAQLS